MTLSYIRLVMARTQPARGATDQTPTCTPQCDARPRLQTHSWPPRACARRSTRPLSHGLSFPLSSPPAPAPPPHSPPNPCLLLAGMLAVRAAGLPPAARVPLPACHVCGEQKKKSTKQVMRMATRNGGGRDRAWGGRGGSAPQQRGFVASRYIAANGGEECGAQVGIK